LIFLILWGLLNGIKFVHFTQKQAELKNIQEALAKKVENNIKNS